VTRCDIITAVKRREIQSRTTGTREERRFRLQGNDPFSFRHMNVNYQRARWITLNPAIPSKFCNRSLSLRNYSQSTKTTASVKAKAQVCSCTSCKVQLILFESKIAHIDAQRSFSPALIDSFQRKHDYLRISLTERCNLRCLSLI
jgi:hypothetical protein